VNGFKDIKNESIDERKESRKEQPISLYEAYKEYQYGIFSLTQS